MRRKDILDQIIEYFSRLESCITMNNTNGLNDLNTLSEDFFCLLLNQVYGLRLKNLNEEKLNYPAVDLGDDGTKISIQISSDSSSEKIKKSISKFIKHELYKRFETLRVVVISTKKTSYRKAFDTKNYFKFDHTTDVICLNDLIKEIRALSVTKQQEILDFLINEFDNPSNRDSNNTLSNEVRTIADLISFLSNNRNEGHEEGVDDVDPEKKIEHRFSDYANFLKDEITSLLPRYAKARQEVENVLDIDPAAIDFTRNFLRNKSNSFLADNDGNPQKALTSFTEYLEDKMGSTRERYDSQAIRYYLIDELIKCNVFPN